MAGPDSRVPRSLMCHSFMRPPQLLHPEQGVGTPFREPVAVEFKTYRRRICLGQQDVIGPLSPVHPLQFAVVVMIQQADALPGQGPPP